MLTAQPLITEFLADNNSRLADSDGDRSDWIELFNAGDAALDLVGWHLTDAADVPTKWTFPNVLLGSGEYLVVFASGKDRSEAGSELHTNFQLDADGEYLALVRPDGQERVSVYGSVDSNYPEQREDVSYGADTEVHDSQTERYFLTPTPGSLNDQSSSVSGFVADTRFAGDPQEFHDRGFYTSPFDVTLTTATPGATLVYTMDGSQPSLTNGTTVVASSDATFPTTTLNIATTTTLRLAAFKDDYHPTNVDTQTYIFADQVVNQTGAGLPTRWGSAPAVDYEMDPEIYDNPAYQDQVVSSLMSLPTVSLTMDVADMWGPNGIYSNTTVHGEAWERAASMELIYPDGETGFQINAGVQIQGGASREVLKSPKHSFRVLFKEQWGPRKLDFPVFGNDATDKFDALLLRGGFNNTFIHWSPTQRLHADYVRDSWGNATQRAMEHVSKHDTFVHLYLNGLYWGLYDLAERPEESFAASYLGGEKEDWDVINNTVAVINGNVTAWNQMMAIANAGVSDEASYQALQKYLDIDNFIDYMLMNYYGANTDWDDHNWYAARRSRVDGEVVDNVSGDPDYGFKFFNFDGEHLIELPNDNSTSENNANRPTRVHNRLMENEEYRLRFADHVQRQFFHDGALTPEATGARYAEIADHIELAIIAESARWGDYRRDVHQYQTAPYDLYTPEWWATEQTRMRTTYFPIRTTNALAQFVSKDWLPSLNAPVLSQHGGSVPVGHQLSMSATPSIITYNTELVALDAPVRAFLPIDDSLETGAGPLWYEPEFDSAGWIEGTNGVGYENTGSTYEDLINTDIRAEWSANPTSLYSRFEFNLDASFDPADVDGLELKVKSDDGYVVYLNGHMVHSKNAPASASWNSRATGRRADFLNALIADTADLSSSVQYLQAGINVLAIQVLNHSDDLDDLLVQPNLFMRDEVEVSPSIIYTLDGSDPRQVGGAVAGTTYEDAITLSESTQINARAFLSDQWSPLVQATFSVIPNGGGIVISEINYNPHEPTANELMTLPNVGSDDFEFIEVYNGHPTDAINLLGMQFVDGVQFTFGDHVLNPGEFAVVVEDTAAFTARYGTDAAVLGQWSGGLSDNGEVLQLVDAAGNSIMTVDYDDAVPWADRADGPGATLELASLGETLPERHSKADSWRGSTNFGGSPGTAGTAPLGVVINEVLTHTAPPLTASDSIELLNTTDEPIDISGWYLSDTAGALLKFQIPAGTSLGPGEYLVFDESDFNPTPLDPGPSDFALSGDQGDDVWLVGTGENEEIQFFVDDVHFGAALNGVSLGRVDGARDRFAPLSTTSLGCENTHPSVGPLIITEVNYAPEEPSSAALTIYPELTSGDLEFVEFYNPTSDAVDLTDWRVLGGVDFDFAAGTTIGAGEVLVLLRFSPFRPENADRVAAFRAHFGIDASVTVTGGYSGQLSDDGERITLERPDEAPLDDPTFIPHVIEDEVLYDNLQPWPAAASGQTLERVSPIYFGNTSSSWAASAATPGSVDFTPGLAGDLTGDGIIGVRDIDFLNATIARGSTVAAYDLDGSGIVDAADRVFLVENLLGTSMGDANLDGRVDVLDLNLVGIHWQQSNDCLRWSDGNFDGNNNVDVSDLNIVGVNWQAGVAAAARLPRAPLAAPIPVIDASIAVLAEETEWVTVKRVTADHSSMVADARQSGQQVIPRKIRHRWQRTIRRRDGDTMDHRAQPSGDKESAGSQSLDDESLEHLRES